MDIDVEYKANDPGSKHSNGVFYLIFYYTVKFDSSCYSTNFTERSSLASAGVT